MGRGENGGWGSAVETFGRGERGVPGAYTRFKGFLEGFEGIEMRVGGGKGSKKGKVGKI